MTTNQMVKVRHYFFQQELESDHYFLKLGYMVWCKQNIYFSKILSFAWMSYIISTRFTYLCKNFTTWGRDTLLWRVKHWLLFDYPNSLSLSILFTFVFSPFFIRERHSKLSLSKILALLWSVAELHFFSFSLSIQQIFVLHQRVLFLHFLVWSLSLILSLGTQKHWPRLPFPFCSLSNPR